MGFADCGLRAVPNTRAPRSASNCAISLPMPEVTPVTNVVWFFNAVCIYTISFLVIALEAVCFCLFLQAQRRCFEIGKNVRPTLFSECFDDGVLSGLPSRREFFNLFSAFGR